MLFAATVAAPIAQAQFRRMNLGPQRIGDDDRNAGARNLGSCCGTVFGLVFVAAIGFGVFVLIQSQMNNQNERRDRPARRRNKSRRRDDDFDDDPPPRKSRRRSDDDDDDFEPKIRSVR